MQRQCSIATAAILTVSFALPAAAQVTTANVHLSSAGTLANGDVLGGLPPAMSDDERYVAFASDATNLVAGDTNGVTDVFVHDRSTGATVAVSRDAGGALGNGASWEPSLSGTGRFVVFTSSATNLLGVGGFGQVYRHDRDADGDGVFDEPGATATIRISQSSGGVMSNTGCQVSSRSISDDGDRVVFSTNSTNLVPGDTNGGPDVFLRIVSAGTTTRVSVSTAGAQGNNSSFDPAISGNGLVVGFQSSASTLVAGDTNASSDIFVRDVPSGVTSLVSVNGAGVQGNDDSWWTPSLSDDGVLVCFMSDATNLVAGDTNGWRDIFVRNRSAGTTTRASVSTSGVEANNSSGGPQISADGSTVVFWSNASNLVAGDTNAVPDTFARVLASATTSRVSLSASGGQGNNFSTYGEVSDDGSHVAFMSDASNLVAGDTNAVEDAFVRGTPFPPPPVGSTEDTSVTFSVNGPVDPHTDGIRDARGFPPTPQVPLQAGNPIGYCVRAPAVPQADGIDTPFPGDVFDYDSIGLPSEAVMFQSPPFLPVPPDGTNQQILEAVAMGVVAGFGLPPPMWTDLPPFVFERDDVDAFSFGEDYFPDVVSVDFDTSLGLPVPPPPAATPWELRASLYAEPIVTDDPPGIVFRFSDDPWAIGLPGTDLSIESGGFDAGLACGPWSSDFEAAGDVFGTPFVPLLTRVGGVTVGGGVNLLIHDNPALALAPLVPPLAPMEDDLDALECVGDNTAPWFGGAALRPGDLHARVIEALPADPAPAGSSIHEVSPDAPVFFSVTRNSAGEPFSAVRSQFVLDGGAAADIYVAVDFPDFDGLGGNLLFLDEAEIGLYAEDASPGGAGALDLTDDLDALILRVCPDYRATITEAIREILGLAPPFQQGG